MIDHDGASWVAPDRYELRPDARRFETWESSYAARLGLAAAVDYALEIGLDEIERCARSLANELREMLSAIPGLTIHDLGRDPAAIVSFSLAGHDAAAVKATAAAHGINVSISGPSSTLLDATARNLPTLVRASPHYFNTEGDLEALVRAIRTLG